MKLKLTILLFLYSFTVLSANVRLMEIKAASETYNWADFDKGERITSIGKTFIGVPYVSGTLEGNKKEKCTVFLDKLDCVTFFETVLAINYLIENSITLTYDNLVERITTTRYRDGIITDYSSRLHYTSEWVIENQKNGLVKDISKDLGGIILDKEINFMSENSHLYPSLKNNKKLTEEISDIEDYINSYDIYYIPRDKVSDIESKLKNGDIVAFVSKVDGLDYDHIGIISLENGTPHLLHASLTKKKVILDKPLLEYLSKVKKFKGISVIRPL